jgi:hypothetical protein
MNLLLKIAQKLASMIAKILLMIIGWTFDTPVSTIDPNTIVTLSSTSQWDYFLLFLFKLAYPSLQSLPNTWVLPSDAPWYLKKLFQWTGMQVKDEIQSSCIVPTKKMGTKLVHAANQQSCKITVCGLDYHEKKLKIYEPHHEKEKVKQYFSDITPLYTSKQGVKTSLINTTAVVTFASIALIIFVALWFFKMSPFVLLSMGSFLFGLL